MENNPRLSVDRPAPSTAKLFTHFYAFLLLSFAFNNFLKFRAISIFFCHTVCCCLNIICMSALYSTICVVFLSLCSPTARARGYFLHITVVVSEYAQSWVVLVKGRWTKGNHMNDHRNMIWLPFYDHGCIYT